MTTCTGVALFSDKGAESAELAQWLHDAIRRQVQSAAELPVDFFPCCSSRDDGPRILEGLRGKFCVGAQLTPATTRLLDERAIPHLDIRVHPLRFLDDLLFAIRPSRPETRAALAPLAIPESLALVTAGLRVATCRLIADSQLPANTLLVVGGVCAGSAFDKIEIGRICAKYSGVLVKAASATETSALVAAVAGVPNMIGTTRDNLFRLLAMPEISSVITDDASVAEESRWFGKQLHDCAADAIRIAWRDDEATERDYLSFDDVVLTADFWRVALAPHADVTPLDGLRLPSKPNRLRISMNSFGEFHEIDTDRIPVGAAP